MRPETRHKVKSYSVLALGIALTIAAGCYGSRTHGKDYRDGWRDLVRRLG
jgi:putative heme degradation protein